MSVKLILIRHAESEAHDEGLRQSRNTKLGTNGRQQAELLAERLRGMSIDVLFCGPWERTKETAQIIADKVPGLFPNPDPRLREIERPTIEGIELNGPKDRAYKQARREAIETADLFWKHLGQGESFADLIKRAAEVKHWLIREYDGQTVAIVSHSQFIATLIAVMELGDRPKPKEYFRLFQKYFPQHTAISVVEYDHSQRRWQVISKNDTSHLS